MASDLQSVDGVDVPFRAFLERAVGGTVDSWRQLVSGNSRSTWLSEVRTPEGPVPAVVRAEQGGGPFSGTELTLEREAIVYRALQGAGVRLPELYGYDPALNALALERVPGSPDWDGDVLDVLLVELRRLHAVDAAALELPGFARTALGDLDLWARIAETRVRPSSPFVDVAVAVLRDAFPGEPDRVVLTHGDVGPGNLLVQDGRVTGLLDWEFSHLGDPHDDLAWITVRTAMYETELPEFGRRVREHYVGSTGFALDERRLRYWQAVIVLRTLITCLASVSNPVRGRDRLVHHMLIPSLDRMLVGALARIVGTTLDEPEALPAPRPLPGADVLREITADVADLVGTIDDDERRQRGKRARFLLSQLAETWPLAHVIDRADQEEGPAAADVGDRLRQLGRIADRRLALTPRARPMAYAELAGFNEG